MNPQSAVPLYYQVEQDLASLIAKGEFAPGSRLPSEDELIEKLVGVSRTNHPESAFKSWSCLELIEIKRGKGTYVLADKIDQELTGLTGFVEDMVAAGPHPSAKVLGTATLEATEEVARQLRIATGTQVMQIKRVRLASMPYLFSLDETHLPLELGQEVWQTIWRSTPSFRCWKANNTTRQVAGSRLSARSHFG